MEEFSNVMWYTSCVKICFEYAGRWKFPCKIRGLNS
jgi:hypothetical protein